MAASAGVGALALLLFCVLSVQLPAPATAGGPCGLDVDPKGPEVRALKTWRRSGAKALPKITEALCSANAELSALALFRLQELGARAVEPLLSAASRPGACSELGDDLRADVDAFGEVLCSLEEREIEHPITCAPVRLKRSSADMNATSATLTAWLGRPAPEDRRAALRAIEAFGHRYDMYVIDGQEGGCSVRTKLSRALLPALQTRLQEERGDLRPAVIRAIGALRDVASPLVPALIQAAGEPALACDSAGALGRIGSKAAGPALGRLLQDPSTPCRIEVMEALAQIGPAPESIAVDAFLADLVKAPCPDSDVLRRGARALIALGGATAPSVHHLLATLDRSCPANPTMEILSAAKALKTAGPGGEASLHRLMRSRIAWLPERLQAAEVLDALGARLESDERELVTALQTKRDLRTPQTPSQKPPPSRPPADEARDAIVDALGLCRRETGLGPLPTAQFTLPPLAARDVMPANLLTACIDNNPCGPTRDAYRQTIEECCRRAFPNTAPGWCRPVE